MPVEDMQMTRRVQREIGKRVAIDSTMVNMRSVHGVIYVTGRVRLRRGHDGVSLEDEMQIIAQNIKRIQGVRDVIVDVSMG